MREPRNREEATGRGPNYIARTEPDPGWEDAVRAYEDSLTFLEDAW